MVVPDFILFLFLNFPFYCYSSLMHVPGSGQRSYILGRGLQPLAVKSQLGLFLNDQNQVEATKYFIYPLGKLDTALICYFYSKCIFFIE